MNDILIRAENIPAQPERVDLHGPQSLTLRLAADIRSQLMGGRTFVMQVAHPQVGAGVDQLSGFRADPWHRLREINKSGQQFIFSGRAAALAEGRRLREIHRNIKGVEKNGKRFHSLNPEVYGWVNTIFLDTHLTLLRLYGTPATPAEEERLFQEWREGGRIFGLRDRDMPATLAGYKKFYREMIADTLEYNDVIHSILDPNTPAPPESLSWLPAPAWRRLWHSMSRAHYKLTIGSLPPGFREKVLAHHPWTDRDEKRFRRFARLVRTLVPRLPPRLRYTGDGYRALKNAGARP